MDSSKPLRYLWNTESVLAGITPQFLQILEEFPDEKQAFLEKFRQLVADTRAHLNELVMSDEGKRRAAEAEFAMVFEGSLPHHKLRVMNIRTLDHLCQLTAAQLRGVGGFGPRRLEAVRQILASIGRHLDGELPLQLPAN